MQNESYSKIKYYIVTPTYNRSQALTRCVQSVLEQNGNDFDFEIIIINDSPEANYSTFENEYLHKTYSYTDKVDISYTKIKYIRNNKNSGVNFSRNAALNYIERGSASFASAGGMTQKDTELQNKSEYIIFLDDDDWLAPNALQDITDILKTKKSQNKEDVKLSSNIKWLVTNRALTSGESLSSIRQNIIKNYVLEFLLLRKSSGDATHAIEKSVALSARFSKKVKQGEEWIYFASLQSPINYVNINTTISEGYSYDGLNTYMSLQEKRNKINNIKNLFSETLSNRKTKISNKIFICLYLFLRVIKTLIKRY